MTPFDYLNSVTENKIYLYDKNNKEIFEKNYQPYLINRGLSFYPDTIFYANTINLISYIDKICQYDYLFYSLPAKKRRSKWHKTENTELLEAFCFLFNCSKQKAKISISLLNQQQKDKILQQYKTTKQ